MPLPEERKRAVQVLGSALMESGKEVSEWVHELRFGNSDDETSSKLRSSLIAVSSDLGWGKPTWPEIPESSMLPFVVDTLGSGLLESSMVRGLLGEYLIQTRPEFGLVPIRRILGSCETSEIPQRLAEGEFKFSTNLAMELCTLAGLPYCYSVRGTGDDRSPHGIIQPYSAPPDLAEFQVMVKDKLLDCLRKDSGRGLVVMPTGSGKTRTTVEALLQWFGEIPEWPPSILWIADRDELCEQAVQTFEKLAPTSIQGELDYWRYWHGNYTEIRETARGAIVPGVTVSSVQQFRRRLENREPSARILIDSCDAIVVDEAHRNLDWIESIGEDIARKKRKTRLIGITATPSRAMISETGRLASLFGNRVFVPIEGGERNPEGMADKLTNIGILSERIEIEPENLFGNAPEGKREFAIIEALLDSGSDSIIVFTNTVEEARNLASISRLSEKIGVNAEHIDAGTPLSSRRSTIEAFRNGEVQVLFNYGILTTGFDAPNIDAVVILRRSIDRSSSLFSQMVGRGLRGPKFGGTEQCRIVHYRGD